MITKPVDNVLIHVPLVMVHMKVIVSFVDMNTLNSKQNVSKIVQPDHFSNTNKAVNVLPVKNSVSNVQNSIVPFVNQVIDLMKMENVNIKNSLHNQFIVK